jgi:hypothetical protein
MAPGHVETFASAGVKMPHDSLSDLQSYLCASCLFCHVCPVLLSARTLIADGLPCYGFCITFCLCPRFVDMAQALHDGQPGLVSPGAETDSMCAMASCMSPFPPQSLGWFCLGYHMSDVLGRPPAIRQLLLRSGLAPAQVCTEENIRKVLDRILAKHSTWIAVSPQPLASLAVPPLTCQAKCGSA